MAATVELNEPFTVMPGSDVVVIDSGVGEGAGAGGGGEVVVVGWVIVKLTVFDVPPLRPEVKTVTLAVPVLAIYEEDTEAFI